MTDAENADDRVGEAARREHVVLVAHVDVHAEALQTALRARLQRR
jgi:hypothetical protein